MDYQALRYEIDDRVAILTLNRPDKMNALTTTMCRELESAVARANEDPGVRVLVLTGAGERAFSAGYDLGGETHDTEPQDGAGSHDHESVQYWAELLERELQFTSSLWACSKPILAG